MTQTIPPDEAAPRDLTLKSILLLDDDIELADTLKELLESHNFVVKTVKNGVEGLREIMDFDYDVIICDLVMPAMAGDMFYVAVQRAKPHLCKRFIFVTGKRDNPKLNDFIRYVNGVLILKPVPASELIASISYVLNQAEKE